ncbi:MAG: hypothetical protein ACLVEV_06920 [Lachnospiraceae bacterium]
MSDNWKKYREDQDDDGRTVADMSDVQRSIFSGSWRPVGGGHIPKNNAEQQEETRPHRPWEDDSLTKEERRMYVLGAMKAALLIGMVYLVGGGVLIALLLARWN